MQVKRQDKQVVAVGMQNNNNSSQLSFNGDSRRRTDHHHHHHHHHQTLLIHNDPGRPVLDPLSTSASTAAPTSSRSISRSRSPPPTTTTNQVPYRECLKNHAASMGGVVLDGCGEFMPAGEDGTAEALKCAACECHRNFHRKEIDGESQAAVVNNSLQSPIPPVSAHHNQKHRYLGAPVMMNFGGAPAEYSSSEDLDMCPSNMKEQRMKKRFRTKFSQEQKDKMMEFAETVGWKIQKQDEQQLQHFCSQVGVKRKVFKVWMHNNKQSLKKKNHSHVM